MAMENKIVNLHGETIKGLVAQANQLQVMFGEMADMYSEMQSIKIDVVNLKNQIDDENRLLPSETDELYEAVRASSIELVKSLNIDDDQEFKREVGKMRRRIWKKANKKFGVSKYIHVRRKDFEDYKGYIKNLKVTDFMQ